MDVDPLHTRIHQILLKSDDTAGMLIELVFELKAQGLSEGQIYDLLEEYRVSVEPDQRENDQGLLLDVMYLIVCGSFPHRTSF